MSIRAQILLLILLPLAAVALLVVSAQRIPLPEMGRGYVLRVELPRVDRPADLPEVAGRAGLPLVVI
ncbi:MAG TPA: N-acetylmuramoyl-L-alanine amidase, partial [Erythrobacter sp.]|nr:N-acetylmuramoyl-L-alanine amidase [Erythrobacter sp.]